MAEAPLWYAHYQTPPDPSFDDFVPFAGWTKPYTKQYADTDGGLCVGNDADINWRP